jgi:hypothetical protein
VVQKWGTPEGSNIFQMWKSKALSMNPNKRKMTKIFKKMEDHKISGSFLADRFLFMGCN